MLHCRGTKVNEASSAKLDSAEDEPFRGHFVSLMLHLIVGW
jgi:hypothetical protein